MRVYVPFSKTLLVLEGAWLSGSHHYKAEQCYLVNFEATD